MHSAEILLKNLQLRFIFNFFFSKFSKNLFNRAPVDGCFCIEKTYKTLNTTSKIFVEVYFLRKCEHFSNTDHLHSHYLREGGILDDCFLNLQSSFSLKPFQLLWLKRNHYFDNNKFCRILMKIKTCKNFF